MLFIRHIVGFRAKCLSLTLLSRLARKVVAIRMAIQKRDNPILDVWHKLPAYLRNRYFLTLVAFTAILVFTDRHDIWTQFKLRAVVNRLEVDKSYYQDKIQEAEAERLDRQINQERFARETYFMQRDDEDVFIIVTEK